MPTVTEFLVETWKEAPADFVEAPAAVEFLENADSLENKLDLALKLLEQVAIASDCAKTWRVLVRGQLLAAEKAMRHLLPKRRDHILHSAHLYLLGVALYLRLIREDGALASVLADNCFRDAQALYGGRDAPYSCTARLIDAKASLSENRARIGATFSVNQDLLDSTGLSCALCDPGAFGAVAHAYAQQLEQFNHCCKPAPAIRHALDAVADGVEAMAAVSEDSVQRLARTPSDLDSIFRRAWGQAALLHDSAYPLELAADQIKGYLKRTIEPLGCTFSPCLDPFGLQLNRLCDFLAVPLVQNVCTTRFNPSMCADNSITLLATNISHKLHVEYGSDTLGRMMQSWLETGLAKGQVDHGVLSALLMLRLIKRRAHRPARAQASATRSGLRQFDPNGHLCLSFLRC